MRNRQWLGCGLILLSAGAAGCSAQGNEEELGTQASNLCTAVTVSSNNASYTAVPGATVIWTASPTCTQTAEYQFWFRSPSGVWTMVQDWSTTSTYNWNTTGLAVGTWNMQVWVRDSGSGSYQAYAGHPFVLSSSAACTAAQTSIAPSAGVAGTSVTFTNTATTCGAPEFQIYHLPPGGSWQLDSAYSPANSTYVWNTTGAALGVHQFQIWARSQGSPQAYQAYTTKSYTVQGATACTSAGVTFSPVGHTSVGTSVAITPTATGCTSPTFRVLYQPPGGAWQDLQAYTANTPILWNTTLAATGVYNFQIWARAAGSIAAQEAYIGTTYTLDASTQVSPLSIGGGFAHACELTTSGKVGCWGYNNEGEAGNGTISQSVASPVAVTGITNAVSLGSGYSHACAALFGGTVKCWGSNLHGQLGDGTTTTRSSPVTVSGLSGAQSVAAGNSHSCAALADGTVRCWGFNSQGQLGNGAFSDSLVPVTVSGLSGVTQVAGGYYHSCALLSGGTVRCWGLGTGGQLGNGASTSSATPVTVSGLTGVVSISSNSSNNCALKSDGTIWCWGGNTTYGTLGSGSTTSQPTPVAVTGITTATSVAIGVNHGCAALANGTATCWGYNFFGQLGNAANADSLAPVAVSNLTNVKSVGLALYSSCATLADNTASCWGYGVLGTLGNGLNQTSNIPVAVGAVP